MITPEDLKINSVVTVIPFASDWLTGETLPLTGTEKLVITDYDNWPRTQPCVPVIVTDNYGTDYQVSSFFLTPVDAQ